MSDIAVVVFDIDGTLLTTGGAGAKAWGLAFQDLYGVDANISDFTEDGWPDHEVARQTFIGVVQRDPSEAELAAVTAKYLSHLDDTLEASTTYRVEPGIVDLLDRLSKTGLLLGITTGNVVSAAHMKLARGRLAKYFTFGGYGSDSADRTVLTRVAIERAERMLGHNVDPQRIIVVGDTPRDVEAAHGVRAISVGVATGHYSVDELKTAGADYALATVESGFPV